MQEKTTRYEQDDESTINPYARSGNTQLVFFDGQVPGEDTALKRGVKEQALEVLERLRGVAARSGVEMQELMRTTVYLTEMDRSGAVESAYDEFFEGQRPSLTLVGVDALPNGAAVQIEATGVNR